MTLAISLPRFTFSVLGFSFLVMVTALLWILAYEFKTINDTHHLVNHDLEAIQLNEKILHFNEASHLSAKMAIISGDAYWKTQYHHYQHLLNEAVKEALILLPLEDTMKHSMLDISNSRHANLEKQALDYAHGGQFSLAINILFGNEYAKLQKNFENNIKTYNQLLRNKAHQHLYNKSNNVYYMTWLICFSLALLLLSLIVSLYFYQKFIKNKLALANLTLKKELILALKKKEFRLFYQPIMNTDKKLVGVEALVRWQHPKKGLLTPDQFLAFCESSGLIIPIGEWILQTACEQMKVWQRSKFPPLFVSVNFSACQFNHPGLVSLVKDVLAKTKIPPASLKIEVTESSLMENVEEKASVLHELKKMGVQLALDDFGTGYSSLSYLMHFPFHSLKIDKSFILNFTTKENHFKIVKAIITLGHQLNLTLIAEGVENQLQADLLKQMRCHYLQGYLFGKPMSAEQLSQSFLQS